MAPLDMLILPEYLGIYRKCISCPVKSFQLFILYLITYHHIRHECDSQLIYSKLFQDFLAACFHHSDGDVFFHAVIDSLLGASSLGDIGTLFPDTDPNYKGISSAFLLEDVVKRLDLKGFQIVNIDTIIIAEEPKLYKYKREIAQNTALICEIDENHIGVKAKTNEKMGFLGRGEGIAVMSSALLKKIV